MSREQAYQGSAGFTLLEALVATLLMTFIFAALAAVTAQWLPNWNRGFIAMQRVELTATGLDRLTADLAEAEFVSAGPTSNAPLFDGAELSVIFVRSKLAPNTGRGLEVVRIAEIGDDFGPRFGAQHGALADRVGAIAGHCKFGICKSGHCYPTSIPRVFRILGC